MQHLRTSFPVRVAEHDDTGDDRRQQHDAKEGHDGHPHQVSWSEVEHKGINV